MMMCVDDDDNDDYNDDDDGNDDDDEGTKYNNDDTNNNNSVGNNTTIENIGHIVFDEGVCGNVCLNRMNNGWYLMRNKIIINSTILLLFQFFELFARINQ